MNRFTASWLASRPRLASISGQGTEPLDIIVTPPPQGRPGYQLLLGTGWHPTPGAEWQEVRPGLWEVAVFRG